MLLRLELENFRKITSKTVDFTEGTNGIFGPNYSGKTTCLLAIAVALGGPSAVRGRNLVNRSASNFSVALELILQGVKYRVERTKDNAKLFKEGQLIASKQTQVNTEISKLLGVPVADWLNLRFVAQKEAAAMFTAGASELNKLIERTTGVQVIGTVITLLGGIATAADAVVEALRGQVMAEADLIALNEKLQNIQIELETGKVELGVLEKAHPAALEKCAAAKTSHGTAVRVRDEAARTLEKIAQLKARLSDRQTQLAAAEKALSAAPQTDVTPEALDELRRHIESLNAKSRAFTSLIDRLQAAETSLARQAKKVEDAKALIPSTSVEDLKSEEAKAEELYEEKRKAKETIEPKLAQLRAELRQALELSHADVCPTCNRAYEDSEEAARLREEHRHRAEVELPAKIRELTAELEQAIQAVDASLRQLRDARAAVSTASAAVKTFEILEKEHSTYAAALETLKADLAHLGGLEVRKVVDAELAVSNTKLVETSSAVKLVQKLKADAQEAKGAVESVRGELEQVEATHIGAELAELEAQVQTTAEAYRQASTEEATTRSKLEACRAALTKLDRELLTGTALLQKHEEAAAKLSANVERAEAARGLQKYLRDHRSRYVQAAWTVILGRASAFAEAATGGVISSIVRTQAGDFEFVEDGHVAQVGDASGAQAAILGLAIQVALAESLPSHLDLLVCDEPTADMDAEHSTASLLALASACSQTVVISHHRFDETICNNIIEL